MPFPGKTMLITAALYASLTHHLVVWLVWAAPAGGAIIGDNVGYHGGYRPVRRDGKKLPIDETKPKVRRMLFDRHDGKVVFFGRFGSILRTYAAFLAGVNSEQGDDHQPPGADPYRNAGDTPHLEGTACHGLRVSSGATFAISDSRSRERGFHADHSKCVTTFHPVGTHDAGRELSPSSASPGPPG